MAKIAVIGSGFAGLSAASCLAQKGHDVTIIEKNKLPGGRARQFSEKGFVFDMGPSWYWMPDVFEKYFGLFGKKVSDYYTLDRLDPSYRVYFGKDDYWDVPANFETLKKQFDDLEPGAGEELEKFMKESAYKYEVGINDLVYKPSRSLTEFMDARLLNGLLKMDVFSSITSYVKKHFKHPKIIELLEFPVLFLGAKPSKTPALYSLMNYADIKLGTWYPQGGMFKIIEGMVSLAKELGVKFELGNGVQKIRTKNGKVTQLILENGEFEADVVVGGADYHHVEQHLLDQKDRNYTKQYWDNRVMAPSSLIFYLGIDKKLDGLEHHNLFFDQPFTKHAEEIYDEPQWPTNPLFYVSCPSKTDKTVAPEGKENIFILVPVAPNLKDTEEIREKYFHMVLDRLEEHTKQKIKDAVIYKRSYAHKDFISDYNAFKGNAYGLANTLKQTAILKPSLKSKKVKNLYFTGQLTVPGPGVPPSLISGQVVAKEIQKDLKLA